MSNKKLVTLDSLQEILPVVEDNILNKAVSTENVVGKKCIDEWFDIGEIFNDYENNKAFGPYSHAEGLKTTANGEGCHAEGVETIASYNASHAEGKTTTASGFCSHAEGRSTEATASYSHAEGYCTTASSESQHVQGVWNIVDTEGKYAHIVGNGNHYIQANAHTLDWDGNAWFAGDIFIGGTSQDDGTNLKDYIEEAINNAINVALNTEV